MDVDWDLVRRIEATAATITVRLVDAMRANDPASPAAAAPMHGGALIATGSGRYVNRAMGVTLDDRSPEELDIIEQFYRAHGLPPAVEVSSWTPAATVAELTRRDFGLAWFRAVFAAPVSGSSTASPLNNDVQIMRVDTSNVDTWMETSAVGFGAVDDLQRIVSDEFARASLACPETHIFMAMIGGRPAGCGALQACDGVAWVGGAATLPAFRRRGVQAALLAHRRQLAEQLGCNLVAATAVPSGQSARNLVHVGFQLIQTQAVLVQPAVEPQTFDNAAHDPVDEA